MIKDDFHRSQAFKPVLPENFTAALSGIVAGPTGCG